MNIENDIQILSQQTWGHSLSECTIEQVYRVLLIYVSEKLKESKLIEKPKKLYYISAEFLIGRLLSNNLIHLGIDQQIKQIIEKYGFQMSDIEECEGEPSLGNGGLGRLASCFLDSMAALQLCADGVGLNYHLGLFKQVFEDHKQKEYPDHWMDQKGWLIPTKKRYTVEYKDFSLTSLMNVIDIAGYDGSKNQLKLFDLETVNESLVKEGIQFDQQNVRENLTLFLYPNDENEAGQKLRIYQEYFLCSSAAQMILEETKEKGYDLSCLHEHVIIQINDTHPSMIIPEMIRLLMKEGMTVKEAVTEVSLSCAYTNHTILAEALEKWPLSYIQEIVPQLYDIILLLDALAHERSSLEKVAIIDQHHIVHMAAMDIHFSKSVNGVAQIHTDILKHTELKEFYELYPERFNNKTNGISFRRWLFSCNPSLCELLDETIGQEYKKDPLQLEKLQIYYHDESILEKLREVKQVNKDRLCKYLKKYHQLNLDSSSIFDIQIKRLHEYKRQQMNLLSIIHYYLRIKEGKIPKTPLTFLFGAKAAFSYTLAKDILHAISVLSEVIDKDAIASKYLKVALIENYNVTLAEKLIPACDISEQISLASKEASGTGNMKLMLNGAVTLGTLDGANVEILDLVGKENIFIFGKEASVVIEHYKQQDYDPSAMIQSDPDIKRLVDFLAGEEMISIGHETSLRRLHQELTTKDWFMTLLDLKEYLQAKDQIYKAYEDKKSWAQKMLVNISKAGYFSSDRTIAQYNEEIWHI